MISNWEQVIAKARLISLPEAYLRLKKVLDQPNFSMTEVAIPISQDPALTARLLRLVNSSFYGLSGTIDTVFRALTMIGTQQVHDLALATAVAQSFDRMDNNIMDMSRFWRDSVMCGLAASNLARTCGLAGCERLFVAGLLHDIGHLVMYQSIPELCQQSLLMAKETGKPLHLIERELIGLDSARVGGALMQQWQFPGSLRETTEFHLDPAQALLYPMDTYLVHIAVALAEEDFDEARLQADSLKYTGLSVDQCLGVRQQTEEDVVNVFNCLFPLQKAG